MRIKIINQITRSLRLYQNAQCPARRHRSAGVGDFSDTVFIAPATVPPPSGTTSLVLFTFPGKYPSVPSLRQRPAGLVLIIFLIEFSLMMHNVLVPELGPLLPLRVH